MSEVGRRARVVRRRRGGSSGRTRRRSTTAGARRRRPLRRQVDGDRPLAAVEVGEVGAHAAAAGADRADEVAGQRFDLDDVGALVGEHHRGERARHVARQIDDAEFPRAGEIRVLAWRDPRAKASTGFAGQLGAVEDLDPRQVTWVSGITHDPSACANDSATWRPRRAGSSPGWLSSGFRSEDVDWPGHDSCVAATALEERGLG